MSHPTPLSVPGRLATRRYSIERGWSAELARQLVIASQEPEMLRTVPRDAAERFPDETAAQDWQSRKQPVVYRLGRAAQLSGIIWYTHQPRPEITADYTFAIRLYEEARGKGLAEPFMQTAEADFRRLIEPTGVWLETDMANSRARNLYHKIGYTVIGASSARITMRR